MGAEPVEGLLAHLVVAEGALLRQDAAAVSSGETASRHGETVDQGDPRVLADPVEQMTPQPLFEDPKVGHLAREGGAVHSAQSREPLAVVTSKVGVKVLLGVYPQELAHHLDGQNFGVAKLGRRTTLARRFLSLDPIVGQAENGDDEGVKIPYEWRPPLCWLP